MEKKTLYKIKELLSKEGWFTGCFSPHIRRSVALEIVKIINEALEEKEPNA